MEHPMSNLTRAESVTYATPDGGELTLRYDGEWVADDNGTEHRFGNIRQLMSYVSDTYSWPLPTKRTTCKWGHQIMAKTITLNVTISYADLEVGCACNLRDVSVATQAELFEVQGDVGGADHEEGWSGNLREFTESAKAALFEVQGDDGGAYQPTVN